MTEKTLILHDGEYKKLNDINNEIWDSVATTLPSSQQFLEDGMDSLSPLLDRRVETLEPMQMDDVSSELIPQGDTGKIFSKTIDLKKYLDIRKIKVEVK